MSRGGAEKGDTEPEAEREKERQREREREGECEQGRGRERRRHNLKQAPGSKLSTQSLMQGLNSQTVRS